MIQSPSYVSRACPKPVFKSEQQLNVLLNHFKTDCRELKKIPMNGAPQNSMSSNKQKINLNQADNKQEQDFQDILPQMSCNGSFFEKIQSIQSYSVQSYDEDERILLKSIQCDVMMAIKKYKCCIQEPILQNNQNKNSDEIFDKMFSKKNYEKTQPPILFKPFIIESQKKKRQLSVNLNKEALKNGNMDNKLNQTTRDIQQQSKKKNIRQKQNDKENIQPKIYQKPSNIYEQDQIKNPMRRSQQQQINQIKQKKKQQEQYNSNKSSSSIKNVKQNNNSKGRIPYTILG